MGRLKNFEPLAAVRAARAVFWEHGFEDASVPALESATGLGRSSLYHEFGSKRGLFDAAIQSYLDEVIRPRLLPLQGDTVSPEAIITYLTGLRSALGASAQSSANGCLLINAASAPIGRDEMIREVIIGYRADLHDAVRAGIDARYPEAGDGARERIAEVVVGLIVAAFALVRVEPESAQRSVTTGMELLSTLEA